MANGDTASGASSTILGVLVGMAAGAALGVLFAPRSGIETREKLKTKSDEMKQRAKQQAADKADMLKSKVDRVADKTKNAVNSGKDAADNV
jgi:gas vesicle protein